MTVAQTRTVDWMGIEKGTEHVSLTVVDDLDWIDEQKHLLLLQEKLNSYLAFIESGEVFERLAEKVGRRVAGSTPVKVTIVAKFELTPRAHEFMEYATVAFGNAGFSLGHRVVEVP